MKTIRLLVLTIIPAIFLGSCNQNLSNVKMKTGSDSLAYAFGIVNYNALLRDSLDIDPMLVAKAFKDGKNEKPLMEDMDARNFITTYLTKLEASKYETYKAENEAYLEQNKAKEGVVTTESGLQYEVIKMGDGAKPTAENTVKVHYTGKFIDGAEFDSSIGNDPLEIGVLGVIPGWAEGLQLMPVGSKFKFTIPQELGYGEQGAGNVIKPYSTLVFEVELLDIIKE